MALRAIQSVLLAMPEARAMPDMRAFIDRSLAPSALPCWDYAPLACAAVGGAPQRALPAATAIFASLAAIHIIDDLLDEDPTGLHRRIGPGRAANLASSFQAAASRALAEAELDAAVERELQARLATMTMATARAQDLDLQPCASEADYWQVIDGKTPPLFCCALALGARIGGASEAEADAIAELGEPLGRLIQISDDLRDALETPASADWSRPRNNLALLYASTAEHGQRARFVELIEQVGDPPRLAEAQAIVFASGAASYCLYRMIEAQRLARARCQALPLAEPGPLLGILDRAIMPLRGLLRRCGVADPEAAISASVLDPAPPPASPPA